MLEWSRYSVYCSTEYQKLRNEIRNPGAGTPKAWAYPWCVLNSRLESYLLSVDLGCGYTNFIEYINRITNGLAVGIDLTISQKDVRDVRFVKGDIRHIYFPDEFFDRVFSVSVLEHVPVQDRKQVFDEIFRVLKPDGLAVLTIDYIFQMNDTLLEELKTSEALARIGSNFYGNYNFQQLLEDYSHIADPLEALNTRWVPGHPDFDESLILTDKDVLVREAADIPDVRPFVYTTVLLLVLFFASMRRTQI